MLMPRHLARIVVVFLVARVAAHRHRAEAVRAARDRRLVQARAPRLRPARGRSPTGWQFTQRGCVITFAASRKIAAERAAGSLMPANAAGDASERARRRRPRGSCVAAPAESATMQQRGEQKRGLVIDVARREVPLRDRRASTSRIASWYLT